MDKDMSNKEIISKVLKRSHNTKMVETSVEHFKPRTLCTNHNNDNIFHHISFNYFPFLEGIKSSFDIIGTGFACKMKEISDISIEEALLSDAYKVQIDMRNIFEKLTTNVSRETEETVGTASE
jgi:hypothetical protein